MAVQNNSLGYIIIDGAEGQIRGASLVTDLRGIPVDFRYTDPIRPTRLERILYGNALDTYLKEELILESLLDSVEVNPQLWVCVDEEILNPLKTNAKVKAVLLNQSNHDPLDAPGHIENTSEANTFLLQADEAGAPLKLKFPTETRPDEMKLSAAILIDAAKTMELLEPLTRIQKALISLASGADN